MPMPTALTSALLVLLALPSFAQDAAKGEQVFKKCKACHQVGENAGNKTGPVLTGVIGRAAGSVEGFKYSKSMLAAGAAGHIWDQNSIFEYINNPTKYLRALLDDPRAKAKMRFKLKSAQDRRDVIAYLATFQMVKAMSHPVVDSKAPRLALSDTPGKICVTNGSHQAHLFIVETVNQRSNQMLAPGGMLCADTDQGGKVSVFEHPDDIEGCTQLMAPHKSNTLVHYMEADRCEWGSHSQ